MQYMFEDIMLVKIKDIWSKSFSPPCDLFDCADVLGDNGGGVPLRSLPHVGLNMAPLSHLQILWTEAMMRSPVRGLTTNSHEPL